MEKIRVHIYNRANDIDDYLALSENELAFYEWLRNYGYLDNDTDIDVLEKDIKFIEF